MIEAGARIEARQYQPLNSRPLQSERAYDRWLRSTSSGVGFDDGVPQEIDPNVGVASLGPQSDRGKGSNELRFAPCMTRSA